MSCLLEMLLRFFFGWKWSDKISFKDLVMELLTVVSASKDIRGSLHFSMVKFLVRYFWRIEFHHSLVDLPVCADLALLLIAKQRLLVIKATFLRFTGVRFIGPWKYLFVLIEQSASISSILLIFFCQEIYNAVTIRRSYAFVAGPWHGLIVSIRVSRPVVFFSMKTCVIFRKSGKVKNYGNVPVKFMPTMKIGWGRRVSAVWLNLQLLFRTILEA